eukprot:UN3525
MYVEASGAWRNTISVLKSVPLLVTSKTAMSFDYHMYGKRMGSLTVKVGSQVVWSRTAISNDAWLTAHIDLGPFSGQTLEVSFTAKRGSNDKGDMAIDHIRFEPCAIWCLA